LDKNHLQNLFCKKSDLDSEADVEAIFVERLLTKLRYPDNRICRKDAIKKFNIGRGSIEELYKPDYILLDRKKRPVIVIDAKAPTEKPKDFLYQVSGYALALNQKYGENNPVKYVVLTNAFTTLVYPWDRNTPLLTLSFADFEEDNSKFVELRSMLSYGAIDTIEATGNVFIFEPPNLDDLIKTFDECHNKIWKMEKLGPTDAFYEFVKIMFIKLREDHRIAGIIAKGIKPKSSNFNFSVDWIQEQVDKGVSDNPLASILFSAVRNDLEERIDKGEIKRIFLKDETVKLKLSTILEVVRRLEHYNLHRIDEDLNGRMFETFLNATVRGKELGQFFTPRSVVKYMTYATQLKVREGLPIILDGCCGSGGFLIEAMATLVHQIDGMTDLTDRERKSLKKQLYSKHLWGMDANETITRIARLNMYLHGDGGSKIYTADTLDKSLIVDSGLTQDRHNEIDELRQYIIDEKVLFNAILTNPPFSMKYKQSVPHEKQVLSQYDIIKTSEGKMAASAKSNVLFIERYYDLLAEDGQFLTVIDDTVLNGIESQDYRDFIFEHFIIKQVMSLPFNTFYRAQAGVKTSVLHLKRKENGEKQGDVFMAILNNIGHDDHKRSTPKRDNFPKVKEYFDQWIKTGTIKEYIEENQAVDENLGCPLQIFVVPSKQLNKNRIDAFYYAPELRNLKSSLKKKEKAGLVELHTGNDFNIVPYMNKDEIDDVKGDRFKYFEITDTTQAGAITSNKEEFFEDLPSRARLRVQTNDVLFAKNISSRGTTVIVPEEFNEQIVTTGFINIRPKNEDEIYLLWSIFESEIFRKQVYYLAVTAVQPEVREEIFQNEFLLPIPKHESDRKQLINKAKEIARLYKQTRQKINESTTIINNLLNK